MKKIAVFLMMLAAVVADVVAQNVRRNHFTVDVSYNFTVGEGSAPEGHVYGPGSVAGSYPGGRVFRGGTVTGGYRFYMIAGLYLQPEFSLYYEDHDLDYLHSTVDGAYNEPYDESAKLASYEVGFGLAGMAGYNLDCGKNRSVDIFTGPYFNCAFAQKEKYWGEEYSLYNKPSLRWRFGVAFNFWRISIKGSFDLSLTNQYDKERYAPSEILHDHPEEANVVNVGIGYHF